MKTYLLRVGNGNDGCYPRHLVEIDKECPYSALEALVINRYISGTKTRQYVSKHANAEGEPDNIRLDITVGTTGENDFGAAWLCAELKLLDQEEIEYWKNQGLVIWDIKEVLDKGAARRLKNEQI